MIKAQPFAGDHTPSEQEVTRAALAWAEFLYDEFMLKKHKQLLLDKQRSTLGTDKKAKQ